MSNNITIETSYGSYDLKKFTDNILNKLLALEILKEFIVVKETGDDLFPYQLEIKPQYVSNKSGKVITKEKFDILRKVFEDGNKVHQ